MGVNHRRFDVRVPQQLLHRAYVLPAFQQMRSEAVSQRMRRRRLGYAGRVERTLECALYTLLIEMMPTHRLAARVDGKT